MFNVSGYVLAFTMPKGYEVFHKEINAGVEHIDVVALKLRDRYVYLF